MTFPAMPRGVGSFLQWIVDVRPDRQFFFVVSRSNWSDRAFGPSLAVVARHRRNNPDGAGVRTVEFHFFEQDPPVGEALDDGVADR